MNDHFKKYMLDMTLIFSIPSPEPLIFDVIIKDDDTIVLRNNTNVELINGKLLINNRNGANEDENSS